MKKKAQTNPHAGRFKVTAHPPFSWQPFLKWGLGGRMPAPLDQSRVWFYYRASNAIWNGLKLLSLKPGDNILFPAYHCGMELDAILKAGISVRFYPVDRETKISVDSIRKNMDERTKAVFIIHYFGFPQDLSEIMKICRSRGLYLIEDCSQGLYSRQGDRLLGMEGDLSVFSMWKTVPIPFGGALVINRHELPQPQTPTPPDHYEVARTLKILLEFRAMSSKSTNFLVRKSFLNPLARAVRVINRKVSDKTWRQKSVGVPEFSAERGDWGIPPLSRWMLSKMDEEEIVRRRRAHFQKLLGVLEKAEGIRPLFKALPAGVCPLFFPLIAEDPTTFVDYIRARGVDCFRIWLACHPHFPKEDYPDAFFLKSHVIALPIHHSLSDAVFDELCGVILGWTEKNRGSENLLT